jgi:hypothetical protein
LDDNDINELIGVLTQKYEQYYGKKWVEKWTW